MVEEILKIRTLNGRIITLTVREKTLYHYIGVDKFGSDTIIAVKDIDNLITLRKGDFLDE
jgi:hypothetical protein